MSPPGGPPEAFARQLEKEIRPVIKLALRRSPPGGKALHAVYGRPQVPFHLSNILIFYTRRLVSYNIILITTLVYDRTML